jgi:hypothetical protein
MGGGGGTLGAIGSTVGGIVGREEARGDLGESRNAAMLSAQILQQLKDAPDISKPLILEKYKQAGVLTPEMEQTITAAEPKAISTDASYKKAQQQALQQMTERATGGLTAADRAAQQEARLGAQGDVQSRMASIAQQAAQRGQAGGTSELAQQLMAAQSGANRESSDANQLAQQAQQAREQAVSQLGQYGSSLQNQDFGQQFQQQQAQQQMERFNVGNQQAQQQRNVGASNQAQAANLANLQQIQNANTAGANQEQRDQLNRQMQQYAANVNTAKIKSGGYGDESKYLAKQGAATAQRAVDIGTSLGSYADKQFDPGGLSGGGGGGGGGGSAGGGAGGMMSGITSMFAYDGGQVPNYKQGGQVPGQANVPGDSPQNDTVHARLSPGEIVVPRSLAESKIGKEMLKLIHAHNAVKGRMNGQD